MKIKRTAARMIAAGLFFELAAPVSSAIPGGSYVLTGKEKSLLEILKADMAKYPDLYRGESVGDCLVAFKDANNLGGRKLAPGDALVFPETPASLKARELEAAEKKAGEQKRLNARNEGIDRFQMEFLPSWIMSAGGRAYAVFESGLPSSLIRYAEAFVDAGFAASMQLKSYPSSHIHVIVFEKPARPSQCFFAAIKAGDDGFSYYTLERGVALFGAGNESVLWVMDGEGERVRLGSRTYTDLAGFVSEIERDEDEAGR